ncbi:MAG TPA: hypothetical protein VHJ18_20920 [Streptosporangiaceae bacterium]|nr:hypothetical protein [Streptosporangiaceae bacterium]
MEAGISRSRPLVRYQAQPGAASFSERERIQLEKLWRERGLTLILVTHDSAIAPRAQRIGVMSNGQLTLGRPAGWPASHA